MEFDWVFVFSFAGLATALMGSALGIVWGAMPGLSVNMAMALLVGFTYSMSAEIAIIFLIAVWSFGAGLNSAAPYPQCC